MATISLDLSKFRSAGVYTVEVDETISYKVDTNAMRLLVGFSKKGPFNKPVWLSDNGDLEKVFGGPDKNLELKGSFFNRHAETLLQRGPVIALNLLKVNENVNGPDQVNYAAMSLDAGVPNPIVSSYNKKKYGEQDYATYKDSKIYAGANLNLGIPYVGNAPYASLFDRSRFWEASDENLLGTVANGLGTGDTTTFEHTNFLNFANVGTEEFSILVFKPENLSGYDVTAREWYGGSENIPFRFIRPSDFISDYFIQVVCVKGNWSNFQMLATDPLWSDYFDLNGIKKSKINSFLSAEGVVLMGSWIGSIIPDFQDKTQVPQNIIDKINNNTTVTGLLASFNKDAAAVLGFDYDGDTDEEGNIIKERGWFTDTDGDGNIDETESLGASFYIDMVGHNFQKGYETGVEYQKSYIDEDGEEVLVWEDGDDEFGNPIPLMVKEKRYGINFLSYNYDSNDIDELTEPIRYAKMFNKMYDEDLCPAPVKPDVKNLFTIANKDEADKLSVGDFVNNDKNDVTCIPGLTRITAKTWIPFTVDQSQVDGFVDGTVKVENASYSYKGETYFYTGYAIYDAQFGQIGVYLYTTIDPVEINDISSDGTYSDLSYKGTYNVVGYKDGQQFVKIISSSANPSAIRRTNEGNYTFAPGSYVISFTSYNDEITSSQLVFKMINKSSVPSAGATFYATGAVTDTTEGIAINTTPTIVDIDLNRRFTITADANVEVQLLVEGGMAPVFRVVTDESHVTMQHKLSDSIISSSLKFIPMKGLKISKRHLPGYDSDGNVGMEAGVEKISSVLKSEGILRGLCNDQMINFRYIVDSMSYGIDGMLGGKVYLSQAAQKRGKCLAILNAPSKREFSKSTNPYFCDTFVNGVDIKPAFKTEYIPLGGNDKLIASKIFSLPDQDNGATYTACFFPNLVYSVNGKSFNVPPAADVCNTLIRKFSGGDPWVICANNNGIISNPYVTGIEYPVDHEDRDSLEPFGINPLITRNGVPMIYGNQTTYQRVKSDLNKLSTRENLNTLEIQVQAELDNYVFLYNNAQTRADVVQVVTPIMEAARISGAIDSYTIQCDDKNNTEELIKEDFGIVEISTVFNHGMEKILSVFRLKRPTTSTAS